MDILLVIHSESDFAPLEHCLTRRGYRTSTLICSGDSNNDLTNLCAQWVLVDLGIAEAGKTVKHLIRQVDAVFIGMVPHGVEIGGFHEAIQSLDELIFLPIRPLELDFRLVLGEYRAARRERSSGGRIPVIERRQEERRKSYRSPRPQSERVLAATGIRIDTAARTVYRGMREVFLTPKEYCLLHLLASRPGHTFTWQEILAVVWPNDTLATADNVHQYVARLRRRLDTSPAEPSQIRNVRGFGYRLHIPSDSPSDHETVIPDDQAWG